MKTKKGFNLRPLGNEFILVAEGADVYQVGRMISMNESAALIWQEVEDKDFDLGLVVDFLVDNYGISHESAEKDAEALLRSWKNAGVIEE